jgi:hypothetical protein
VGMALVLIGLAFVVTLSRRPVESDAPPTATPDDVVLLPES